MAVGVAFHCYPLDWTNRSPTLRTRFPETPVAQRSRTWPSPTGTTLPKSSTPARHAGPAETQPASMGIGDVAGSSGKGLVSRAGSALTTVASTIEKVRGREPSSAHAGAVADGPGLPGGGRHGEGPRGPRVLLNDVEGTAGRPVRCGARPAGATGKPFAAARGASVTRSTLEGAPREGIDETGAPQIDKSKASRPAGATRLHRVMANIA